jgi:hypothetical protein
MRSTQAISQILLTNKYNWHNLESQKQPFCYFPHEGIFWTVPCKHFPFQNQALSHLYLLKRWMHYEAGLWFHLRSKSYMYKGQILGMRLTFPCGGSLSMSCSIITTPSPPPTCRYFLQEDLERVLRPASRWSIHRNASPGSASADGCSLQRSPSHHKLPCIAFSCRH